MNPKWRRESTPGTQLSRERRDLCEGTKAVLEFLRYSMPTNHVLNGQNVHSSAYLGFRNGTVDQQQYISSSF